SGVVGSRQNYAHYAGLCLFRRLIEKEHNCKTCALFRRELVSSIDVRLNCRFPVGGFFSQAFGLVCGGLGFGASNPSSPPPSPSPAPFPAPGIPEATST